MCRYALLGIDGCGKSTILDKMKEDEFFKNYHFLWVRWKPYFLRPLYKAINKGKYEKITEQKELNSDYNKKSSLKRKIFKSSFVKTMWLKMAYMDYKYIFKKKIRKLKEDGNIVFDRYFYDLFIDQGLNFDYDREKIYTIIKKYEKKFPSLNQVFYIRVTPKTSFARKHDIPNLDYLNKRFEVYEYLAEKMNWVVINAEQEIEVEYSQIKSKLLEA